MEYSCKLFFFLKPERQEKLTTIQPYCWHSWVMNSFSYKQRPWSGIFLSYSALQKSLLVNIVGPVWNQLPKKCKHGHNPCYLWSFWSFPTKTFPSYDIGLTSTKSCGIPTHKQNAKAGNIIANTMVHWTFLFWHIYIVMYSLNVHHNVQMGWDISCHSGHLQFNCIIRLLIFSSWICIVM